MGDKPLATELCSHFECPVCCLVMTPPGRNPMITECGHTICQSCVERLTKSKCPLCNADFSKTVQNFIVSEIIDDYIRTHELPEDSNPESSPPARICTFTKTSKTFTSQRWYHCKTCGLEKSLGCCQICAETCHKGHEVVFDRVGKCFCDCGAGAAECLCASMGDATRGTVVCSFRSTGRTFIQQEWFRCNTCHLVGHRGCCSVCARTCHRGHDVVSQGVHDECYCDCGSGRGASPCTCMEPVRAPVDLMFPCSHAITGDEPVEQVLYECRSCGVGRVCETCVRRCHTGHNVNRLGQMPGVCGCSDGQCLSRIWAEPTVCSRVKPTGVAQMMYTCHQCDQGARFCAYCAKHCHNGHPVETGGFVRGVQCECKGCAPSRPVHHRPMFDRSQLGRHME